MNTPLGKTAWGKVARSEGWTSGSPVELGPHTSHQYRNDPKHLSFVLARYKFCSKLLAGRSSVLEVGCGDAFGTALVAQAVGRLLAIDQDVRLVESNLRRLAFLDNCTFRHHDMTSGPVDGTFNGVYLVDVIEHVDHELENVFMEHTCQALAPDGLCIVGTPNARAEQYASESSKLGHVNLKDASSLKELMSRFFDVVFVFSMNDEVVHTGFYGMAHYLFGVGVGRRRKDLG